MLSNTYRAKSTTPDLLAIDLGAGQLTYSNLGARHTADLDGGGALPLGAGPACCHGLWHTRCLTWSTWGRAYLQSEIDRLKNSWLLEVYRHGRAASRILGPAEDDSKKASSRRPKQVSDFHMWLQCFAGKIRTNGNPRADGSLFRGHTRSSRDLPGCGTTRLFDGMQQSRGKSVACLTKMRAGTGIASVPFSAVSAGNSMYCPGNTQPRTGTSQTLWVLKRACWL